MLNMKERQRKVFKMNDFVYVVMSEINGYKNIHQVFDNELTAYEFVVQSQNMDVWSEHYFYVLSMPVLHSIPR